MSRLDLTGRVVAITGGADGIGLAVAREVRRRGATAVLLDIDGDRAAAQAQALGGGSLGLYADVTDADGLQAGFDEAAGRLGGIDVVVANAGIGPLATTVDAGDREQQRRVLDVNLHGVWHTAWAGGRYVAQRRGHFVVISSIAAFVVTPSWAAYAASKAGVEALARSMRIELAPTGATVGVVHFGVVATGLVARFEQDGPSNRLEDALGGWLTKRISPQEAAAALVSGIERRAPRTVHPRRWVPFYAARGLTGPIMDAVLVRDPRVKRVMKDVRARDAKGVPLAAASSPAVPAAGSSPPGAEVLR